MVRLFISFCGMLAATVAVVSAQPATLPATAGGAEVSPDGRVSIGGLRFALAHYGQGWSTYTSNQKLTLRAGSPEISASRIAFSASWEIPPSSAPSSVEQTVTADDGIDLSWQVRLADGISTDTLCVSATIPLGSGAGQPVLFELRSGERESFTLPASYDGKGNLYDVSGVTQVTIPSPGGTVVIEGKDLRVSLHDDRQFGGSSFSMRISFFPRSGAITDSALQFRITHFDKAPDPFPTAKIEAGPDWSPFQGSVEVEPGSVFDRSRLLSAPAGKSGRVAVSPSGQFVFSETGQRARFWGVNLCFDSLLLTPEQADQLADRLARAGYNTVRLHHYDGLLVDKNGSSYDLNPDRLDRLEYLFAALKKRGIYLTIDLYTFRGFPIEEIPDLGYALRYPLNTLFKLLVPVSENAFTAWKKFAHALMTHRNPYTGLTWAEDPALVSVCMINEDSIFFGGISRRKPEFIALYDKSFSEWLAKQPMSATSGQSQDALFNRFLVDIKKHSDARMEAYLREIGVQCLVTSDNNINKEAQVYVRDQYDFVDNHEYWNHPVPLGPNVGVNQNSAIVSGLWLPRELMPSRIFGKPYTITEYNFCWPNAARAEAGLLMPAYAGLQDWDAIYCFDYSSQDSSALFTPKPVEGSGFLFSIVSDPIGMLTDRIAATLFLHGGITPAKGALSYLVDPTLMLEGKRADTPKIPEAFSRLGLITRIGSVPITSPDLPTIAQRAGIEAFITRIPKPSALSLPVFSLEPDLAQALTQDNLLPAQAADGTIESSTKQIAVSPTRGFARLVTDYAECFVLPSGQTQQGRRVTVESDDSFSAVYVVSADDRPLASTNRLAVLHLTDVLPSGTTFTDKHRTVLQKFGVMPYLIRRGTAKISVSLPATDKPWSVWAIDPAGRRLFPVECMQEKDVLKFTAATITPSGTALAYEIVR
ncbi:hypothetical protein TSACC_2287 [Terrimicrobium sacchariphilum]|uniref:Cellulase n=1 Tax=Terrimicrobium sacchariphilum TaxID=690879 RepID=A0A146G337_TERSA|nr:hypothetical protein [Terrimicrobium sacchariphilum]GAT31893.1 hypothetical protein TSACC_2287 [Terrimicrobium sacchariphilum]